MQLLPSLPALEGLGLQVSGAQFQFQEGPCDRAAFCSSCCRGGGGGGGGNQHATVVEAGSARRDGYKLRGSIPAHCSGGIHALVEGAGARWALQLNGGPCGRHSEGHDG